MWDTGCSLPGLITLTKYEEWKERFGMKLKHEKWYEKGKEISGVSADNPVIMVGTVVFEFSHGGRSFDLEFGVLKGGDTGSADVIVGNYVLRNDRYDGAVDVGAGVVTLRKVDSRGVMKIPVTTELAGLASMLAAHMAHDEIDRDGAVNKDETVPAAFDASKGRMILDEEFLTLLPGEARWCHVKLQDQAGAVMDGQSFVAMDGEDEDAASGMGLAETKALLESGDGGAAHVMVRNDGENPMEFDREDGICGVQLVDRTEIRAAGEVTKEMRSGLAPECSALFAQYELESKAEASGRREHETFTAVSLKEEEVNEACQARHVGVQRSEKTGGLSAVASQKWCPEQGRIGRFKETGPRVAREVQAYDGTWFTLPAQVIDKRLIEVWKRHPRDAAAREVTASHVVSRASWSQRDHERGFKAKTRFDASMPNNYCWDKPELEGDIAVDKDIRRLMRTSYEATAQLREASARRTEFENKVGRGRRVRFDMRLQVCGWNLSTFTVPWEDDPEGGRAVTSEWKQAVERERVRVPLIGRQAMSASVKQSRQNVARVRYPACGNGLVFKELATWDDLMANYKSPKFIFGKIDPSVWARPDVMPSVVMYAGIGGLSKGSIVRKGNKWVVCALAIEGCEEVAQVHQWNNPSVPVVVHHMKKMAEVLALVEEYLPRKYWGKMWIHASNSCKLAAAANMLKRDLEAARADTLWAISVMQRMQPAVWTLENVPGLHQFFKGKFATCYIFDANKYSRCGQSRRRLLMSNRALHIRKHCDNPLTMRDVLGEKKGWPKGQFMLQRNGYGNVKSVDHPSFTVTSGYLQAGAEHVGDFEEGHILTSDDRALLQGFTEPLQWPRHVTETKRKAYVAQCVAVPFAEVISEAAFSYQNACLESELVTVKLAQLDNMSEIDSFVLACALADERVSGGGQLEADLLETVGQKVVEDGPAYDVDDLGHHGVWAFYGEELGWVPNTVNRNVHRQTLTKLPWLICRKPPLRQETVVEFRDRREKEKWELHNQMFEEHCMAEEDVDVAFDANRGKARRYASTFSHRMFMNIHPRPDELARYDSNAELQKSDPLWYGPYLDEGKKYHTPRTEENVDKAAEDMGLNDLNSELVGERQYYRDLIYEFWLIFDGLLRAIKGVEIHVDLSGVKPHRTQPYRWSPAKVAAGKKLIESFVQDGIMSPISSEWAWPGILVPKPKGGWRFVVDLRELNKLIPHDTYEPPACDACLDWLAGRPYRTTLDLLHGFHGVLLSPETRKIFTVVTPFGTYCYNRLVMGYINATAEFQRHTNATFGELLWDSVLAMVDDVCIASAEVPQHRGDVRAAFDRLARRHHAVKPIKANILNDNIEYLGHISTPEGLKPTDKHVKAIREMPPPIDKSLGLVNKTQLRSFIGLVKYVRRYIKNCGLLCDPLNQLLKDDSDGKWLAHHELAYASLKHEIAYSQGVWHINYKLPIFVCTDGSKRGIGGYIYQKVDGEERVVSYFSRATRKDERKWDTRELEVLALIATLEHFHHFVDGQKLYLQTDHKNITWLGSMKNFSGRLGRWVLRLSEYNAEVAYRKGAYLYVADCLSRSALKEDEGADETDDPIAGRMPRGIDSREDEERDFKEKFTPAHSARAEENVVWGTSDETAVAEVVITEISPYDTDTQTTFMCEYHFKTDDEKELANEAEVERCFCARTHNSFEEEGGEPRIQRSVLSLAEEFEAFAATRSQRAAADKKAGGEATASEPSASGQTPNAKPSRGSRPVGTQVRTGGAPGTSALKGTRGAREQEEVEAEENAVRTPDEQLECDKKDDPLIFGDEMMGEKLGHTEIKKAQQADEFAQMMVERCTRAGASKDKRASKFMVIDGALYRVTGSGDPQEGGESQRIYVPLELRKALMRNYHSTVWAKHQHSRSMHKQMVAWYYWNTMEKDIQEYVSTCELCQLAKGTKPSRQGFLGDWKHSKVLHTVCMDLIGPIGAEVSGGKAGAKPRHILVITDPYSRMVWLEVIVTKSAEEVYEKFVNRFLLEEGCPKVILTDNGREFSNKLLRELMRLCRIRLKYTPPYHPRGNYTERVNRFVGESLRAMVNSPSGKKQDWYKLVKFVQFAYRRMYIPGTNLTPYMVARGRQPISPNEVGLVDEEEALLTGPSLDEHNKALLKNLETATRLLTQAREAVLRENRIKFNQSMIETVFEPGEIVRFFNHVVHRVGETDEIASKFKLKNRKYEVVSRKGTVYELRELESGATRMAHVSQIARMRLMQDDTAAGSKAVHTPSVAAPMTDEVLWDKLRLGSFVLFHLRSDPKSYVRCGEVTQVDHAARQFTVWFNIHRVPTSKGEKYDFERPLGETRFTAEYRNKRGESGWIPTKGEKDKGGFTRCTWPIEPAEAELIVSGFNMEHGGKVPRVVQGKCDDWLRKSAAKEERALVALSEPRDSEIKKIDRMLKRG